MKKSLHKHHAFLVRNNENKSLDAAIVLVFCSGFLFMTGFCYVYAYLGEFGIPIDSIEIESHKILFYGIKSLVHCFMFSLMILTALILVCLLIKLSVEIKRRGLIEFVFNGSNDARCFISKWFVFRWNLLVVVFPFGYIAMPFMLLETISHVRKKREEANFFKAVIVSGLLWSFLIGVTHGFYSAKSLIDGNDRYVFAVIGSDDQAISVKQIMCGDSKCAFYSNDKKVAYIVGNEQLKLTQYTKAPFWFFSYVFEFMCSASFIWNDDCNINKNKE